MKETLKEKLWKSSSLLIPLDTHVLQEAQKLGLISEKAKASRKTALELTEKMKEVFPGDPARADYALFGLGVDGGVTGVSPVWRGRTQRSAAEGETSPSFIC